MKSNKAYLILIILIAALAFRLYFSFQTPYFSDGESFSTLRSVNYILETHKFVVNDPLSFGGREQIGIPVFEYLLAGLSFIPYAYKIVPEILIVLTGLIAYLIALKLTDDKISSLLSALMVSFLPSVIVPTLNKLSVFSLLLPLSFYMVYCLIRIEEKMFLNQFVILSFVLPLVHHFALLVSVSLFAYIILIIAEPRLNLNALRKEAIIFSVFLGLLVEFIIYKKAFLALGMKIIWQNIPSELLAQSLTHANLLDIIYSLGVIPFIFGITGAVFGVMRDKTHVALLIISLGIAPLGLLVLKLIQLTDALIFLGPTFSILSALSFKKLFRYLKLTKFAQYRSSIKFFFFVLIFLTIIIPTYFTSEEVILDSISNDEVAVLTQLGNETDVESIIASSPEEGHYVSYFANRKNVMDTDFLYIPRIDTIYNDIKTLYTTISGSQALEITHKYGIDYIYLSPRTKKFFGIKELPYTTDGKCFRKIAESGEVEAYKIRC